MVNKKIMWGVLAGINLVIFLFLINFSIPFAFGEIGNASNVTTNLTVGAAYPTILNVSIDNDSESVTLVANDTKMVTCIARIVDFNGEETISNVHGTLYDVNNASYEDDDDNNNHYTNASCNITTDFGEWKGHSDDEYHVLSNCTFEVEYYANPSSWNCSILITDEDSLTDQKDDNITILELLSMGLPDSIEYGTINATYVSDENVADIENLGNVEMDLSLSAFASTPGDNLSMICTLGLNGTIGLQYERYNLSNSTPGDLSLTEFNDSYKNVSSSDVLEDINLNYRFNDTSSEAILPSYWRMYVPRGVAGTCEGKVQFSAVQSV